MCDCKVFTRCVSDVKPPQRSAFTLKIPLLQTQVQQSLPTAAVGTKTQVQQEGQQSLPTAAVGTKTQVQQEGQQSLPSGSEGQHGIPIPSSESEGYATDFCGLTCEEVDEILEVLQQQLTPHQQSVVSVLDEDLGRVLGMDVNDYFV